MKIARPQGQFEYVPGHGTYCRDAVPMAGYTLAHATFMRPAPLEAGFAAIASHLAGLGRPMTALCGAELRIAQALSFDGFGAFNARYIGLLDHYALRDGNMATMTRTNVAPEEAGAKPAEPSIYGFTYTVPGARRGGKLPFMCSGNGELDGSTRDTIVRLGDTSPDGMRAKARYVMQSYTNRFPELGVTWSDVSWVNMYCVHPAQDYLAQVVLAEMGPAGWLGVHWHYSRPPIIEIEFEADVRGVDTELFI